MRTGGGREWDILDENTVSDVMTREVLSSPSRTSVREAAAVMLESDVHRLLIIDDGELRGIVTTTDIVRAVARGKLED
jgi:CBS domain-containing protein